MLFLDWPLPQVVCLGLSFSTKEENTLLLWIWCRFFSSLVFFVFTFNMKYCTHKKLLDLTRNKVMAQRQINITPSALTAHLPKDLPYEIRNVFDYINKRSFTLNRPLCAPSVQPKVKCITYAFTLPCITTGTNLLWKSLWSLYFVHVPLNNIEVMIFRRQFSKALTLCVTLHRNCLLQTMNLFMKLVRTNCLF